MSEDDNLNITDNNMYEQYNEDEIEKLGENEKNIGRIYELLIDWSKNVRRIDEERKNIAKQKAEKELKEQNKKGNFYDLYYKAYNNLPTVGFNKIKTIDNHLIILFLFLSGNAITLQLMGHGNFQANRTRTLYREPKELSGMEQIILILINIIFILILYFKNKNKGE